MQLALSNGVFALHSLERTFGEISKIGYKFIELSHPGFEPHKATDNQILRIEGLLKKHSLELAAVGVTAELSTYYIASANEDERKIAVENWQRAIKTCAALDCRLMTTEMAGGNPKERDSGTKAFMKSVQELDPILKKEDIHISFEPHPGDFIEESNPTVDLIKKIGNKNIGYLYCASHTFVMGKNATEMLRYARGVLSCVYVSDTYKTERIIAPPEVKAHEHLIPGKGEVNFEEIFKTLRKIGYNDFIIAQPFSYSDIPVEAAKETKDKIEELMKV